MQKKIIKPLLIIVSLFISFSGISQNDEDCWKCILASEKKDAELTIEECSLFINTHKYGKSVDLAKFILAKTNMEIGKFNDALSQLSSIQTSSSFFSSIINGLLGDCHLEMENYKKATVNYKKAILSNYNYLTPYYLYKAVVVAKKQDKFTEEQYYLRTIKKYFPHYLSERTTSSYLANEDGNFLKLNPKKIVQPKDLGYGTIYGEKVDIKVFDSIMKNQKVIEKIMGVYSMTIDQIWAMYTRKTIIDIECNTIGVKVDKKELYSYMLGVNGFSVPEHLKRAFVDENGVFNRELLFSVVSSLNSSPSNEELDFENTIRESRLREKLMFIYKKGLYLNTIELEELSQLFSTKKSISYIFEPYYATSDSIINTKDIELRDYFNKHQFDSEYNVYNEEREVIIVTIPNNKKENFASELQQRIHKELSTIAGEYDKVEVFSKIINDSNYMNQRLSVKRETAKAPHLFRTDKGKQAIREFMFSNNAKVGAVLTPPVYEDNQVKIAILASIKYRNNVPFESVKEKLTHNYIIEKKAEIISNHLKSVDTEDQLLKLQNVESGNVIIEQSTPYIKGPEPNIISFVFKNLKNGVWSSPVAGNRGVYRIKVLNTEKNPSQNDQINESIKRIEMANSYKIMSALEQSAQIIDNTWFVESTY